MWEEDRMRNDCSWAWVSFWVDKNVLELDTGNRGTTV